VRRGAFERRRLSRFEHYLQARQLRADDGLEPVRCCCNCRLVGWLAHAGAVKLEAGTFKSTEAIVLTYASLVFGVIDTGEPDPDKRTEHAWQSNDYALDELRKFPTFEEPTEHELLVDPAPSWTLAGYLPTDRGLP